MAVTQVYPVRVDASLDSPLSRWLWLVKWVLVIPHYIVLAFLWLAFVVLSIVAFFAILFTGRYPRAIFGFNVGVLRWTWRVQYYAIGAFGTDRYPPFTLADDPSYPAHLEIEYPGQLSRGLVLVKWWLLAIPHYIVVGIFTSGLAAAWWYSNDQHVTWPGYGLIGLLAIIAAIVLLFTGRYPEQIFDFVLGMNRWVLRVAAYASLMTDQYPPFRLDMGGHEPGGPMVVSPPAYPPQASFPQASSQPPEGGPPPSGPPPSGPPPSGPPPGGSQAYYQAGPGLAPMAPAGQPGTARRTGWTAGRIVAVVIGAVLTLCSLGLLAGGGVALWATTQREAGYLDFGSQNFSTHGYAIASGMLDIHAAGNGWDAAQSLFGTVRLRVTSLGSSGPVFLGIAPAAAATRYLSNVSYATVSDVARGHPVYQAHIGTAPAAPPVSAGIWAVKVSGPGTQTLTWPVKSGHWTIVAMNADGSQPVSVRVNAAATLPPLPWIATGLLIGGVLLLLAGAALIAVPLRRVL